MIVETSSAVMARPAAALHTVAVISEGQARNRRKAVAYDGQGAIVNVSSDATAPRALEEAVGEPAGAIDSQILMNAVAATYQGGWASWLSESSMPAVLEFASTLPVYNGTQHGLTKFCAKETAEAWADAGRVVLRVITLAPTYLPKDKNGVHRAQYLHALCSRESGTRKGSLDFGWFESYQLSTKPNGTVYGNVKYGKNPHQACTGGVDHVSSLQVARDAAHLVLLRLKRGDAGVIHVMTANVLHQCSTAQSPRLNILQYSVLVPVHICAAAHAHASLPTSPQPGGPTARNIGFCTGRLAHLMRKKLDEDLPEVLARALRMGAISVLTAMGTTDAAGFEDGLADVHKRRPLGDDLPKLSLKDHRSAMVGLACSVASGAVPSAVNALYNFVGGDSLAGTALAGMQVPRAPQPLASSPPRSIDGVATYGQRRGADADIAGTSAGAHPNLYVPQCTIRVLRRRRGWFSLVLHADMFASPLIQCLRVITLRTSFPTLAH